jgi:DNA ligase-1
MHRRRKYGIKKAAEEFPVNLFIFDALYLDGKDMTQRPYLERREALKNVIKETERFKLAEALVTDNPREVEKFFEKSIAAGCEGLILKSEKGIYQAGARGWLWIKLKKSYESKMIEPIDAVIVGAFSGRGKRSGTYGALLASVYDKKKDVFVTICKVGSGFSDEDLGKLPAILSPSKIDHVHPRVVSELEADVWFTPKMVIEIIGDELTLSPVHTCAYGVLKEGAGIAIRFPRFTGSWRLDKSPEDATTVEEIMDMYKGQLKKI